MRKILSLVLALSMVLGMFSCAFASNLSDIDGEYYEAAVEALVELGVVNGYGDGTYKPNQVVTRAELAKMLVISLGQKQAADIAKGATQFADVSGDHWASGFINVAAQYKVVVGYPDGTFHPESTVTYAEAVTMALRALGYKNVVEAAGTWPTNYITKANELQLLRDMKYDGADDGAKRGNVAILLWNMLRTEMWAINAENQTNGMTYMKTEEPMLNIKFPGYAYDDELELDLVTIADDGKVTVKFFGDATEYALKGGDLLRMIAGMKVAALVNLDDEEVLSLTCVDTMIEGRRDEDGKVAGRKYAALDTDGVYYVAVVDGKELKAGTVASELPDVSEELTEKKIKSLKKNDEDAEKIYLIDGEWSTVKDLEEGDVITEVADLGAVNGTFWAVSRKTVEGEFEAYVTDDDGDHLEVDGEEYDVLAGVKYYEFNSSKDKDVEITKADLTKKDNKYIEEDVKLVLNYLGDVVAVYFDEINEKATSSIGWYVQTGNRWTETGKGGIKGFITLTDANGDDDDYEYDYSSVTDDAQWTEQLTNVLSTLAKDSDGDGEKDMLEASDILDLVMPYYTEDGMLMFPVDDGNGYYKVDDTDAVGEYAMYELEDANGIFDADTKYFLGTGSDIKVSSATKVIKITPVFDDGKVVEVRVEVSEGPEEVEGITAAKVVVKTIVEDDVVTGEEARAAYVFVAEDASSADLTFDRVAKEQYTKNGRNYINAEENGALELANPSTAEKGSAIAYTTKDEKINVRFELKPTDVDDGYGVVTKVDNELIYVDGNRWLDTDNDKDTYRHTRYVLVSAGVEEDKDTHDDMVVFDDIEELGEGLENAEFEDYDRLFFTSINGEDFVFIIRASEFGEDTVVTAGVVTD